MRRILMAALIIIAPATMTLMVAGCNEPKVKTVEQKESKSETDPKMVSPGHEVVE